MELEINIGEQEKIYHLFDGGLKNLFLGITVSYVCHRMMNTTTESLKASQTFIYSEIKFLSAVEILGSVELNMEKV